MKKFVKVLEYALLVLLALGVFAFVTHHYYSGGFGSYASELEKMCYAIWGILFAVVFYAFAKRIKRTWLKSLIAVLMSTIYTAIVFFVNNYWRYISWCVIHEYYSKYFGENFYIPYNKILQLDITYTYALGEYRYPMVFLIMLLLCGFVIFITHPIFKKLVEYCRGIYASFVYWCHIQYLQSKGFPTLYFEMIEQPDYLSMYEYLYSLPRDEETKNELLWYIETYQHVRVIDIFITRYGELLTKDEYIKVKQLYEEIKQKDIDDCKEKLESAKMRILPMVGELDRKFDIEDEQDEQDEQDVRESTTSKE